MSSTSGANTLQDEGEDAVQRTMTQYLSISTRHLHDVPTRTDPDTLATEVRRLNAAVRACAVDISPYAQPADYQQALLRERDAGNGTPSFAPTRAKAVPPEHRASGCLTLAQASRKLESGEISAEQLTVQALSRAMECQPVLNAFIEIWADRALEQARRADAARASGRACGPLHGIPLAHKDCFEIVGHAATIGSRARPAVPATSDAEVIRRLDDAGAVTLGVLNMSEMVAGPTGQNPAFGDCCNALDPARISGGSSSGSGTAVAAGAIFASLGSDTGGSIRLPASAHGLFGLKPTYGRISRSGCFPRAYSLDCAGPLARTAEDCAIVLQAVAGRDPDDPSSLDVPVPRYRDMLDSAADRSRVAVLGLSGKDACTPEIAAIFEAFIVRVEGLFGGVRTVNYPRLSACYAMGDVISKVEAAMLHSQWMRENAAGYSQAVYSRTEPGLHVPAVRYLEATMLRARLLREFLTASMAGADILLCPTMPVAVPLRADADMEKKGGVFNVVTEITRLTRPFSYLGVPVLSVPIGYDEHGMPVGAQLIGRPLSEARLLSFAHQMSRS